MTLYQNRDIDEIMSNELIINNRKLFIYVDPD